MCVCVALGSEGTSIMASDHLYIIDDNLVGNVTEGGDFCLDLVTGGMLEVWAVPLVNGCIGVALLNRSPADDIIILKWSDIGVEDSSPFVVRDVWAEQDLGVYEGQYARLVAAHASVFLVLTPA
jgi:hypothetical protein